MLVDTCPCTFTLHKTYCDLIAPYVTLKLYSRYQCDFFGTEAALVRQMCRPIGLHLIADRSLYVNTI